MSIAFATGAQSASWQQITTCGEMKGQAYYFPGGAVPRNKSGWRKDGIDGGTTALLTNGKDVDIVYKDATGNSRSSRFHDQAQLFFFPGSTIQTVLVVHKNGRSLEQYAFQLDHHGQGIVFLTQQRDGVVSKVSVMEAVCKRDR